MQTTYNQRQIIGAIVRHFDMAMSSNDFNSPSHNSLIEDEFNDLVYDEVITQQQADKFASIIQTLHWEINKIK